MKNAFTIFPAIDLRRGQVVRLQQGDPGRQKTYFTDPAEVADLWLDRGARWLHVVNLDGAFGEEDTENRQALEDILRVAEPYRAKVQFGGGLRSIDVVQAALKSGVGRVVIGTAAVEQPEIVAQAIQAYGEARVAVGIDARQGWVKVRGWVEGAKIRAADLAGRLGGLGLRWLVFTDIARDGLGAGLNLEATEALAKASGLQVIASGGVRSAEDVRNCRNAGLAGVIIGHALYEGKVDLERLLKEEG